MIKKTIITITSEDLMKMFTEYYNRQNGTNHAFYFESPSTPKDFPVISFGLARWDKDERHS